MPSIKRLDYLKTVIACVCLAGSFAVAAAAEAEQYEHCDYYQAGDKQVYWGDLHVHSGYSLDAWGYGTANTPREAYDFAKGAPMNLPSGQTVRLERPLDFMSVTDHAEWFNLMYLSLIHI